MKKNKIIKGVVLSTMLFSTVVLPFSTIQSIDVQAKSSHEITNKNADKNVDEVRLTFYDILGNKMGTQTKTNIFINKSFEIVSRDSQKYWKMNSDNNDIVKKGGTNKSVILESNKNYEIDVFYKNGTELLATEKVTVKHGALYNIKAPKIDGYKATDDIIQESFSEARYSNGDKITDDKLSVDIEYEQIDNKSFVLGKSATFEIEKYVLDKDIDEATEYFEIVDEKYNKEYKDVFSDINKNTNARPLKKSQNHFSVDFDGLQNPQVQKTYVTNTPKDYQNFDEAFGEDYTGIPENSKVIDLDEIVKYHSKNYEIPFIQAYFNTIKETDFIAEPSSLFEKSEYLTMNLEFSTQNLAEDKLVSYLDNEVNDVEDILVFDSKVDMNISKNLRNNYKRIDEYIDKEFLNKRVSMWTGNLTDHVLTGFHELYKDNNDEYRARVVMFRNIGMNTFAQNQRMEGISYQAFKLDSEITVNYVSESGRILETSKEIIDKNTEYNIENKEFENYKLKNENDKDKKIFVNKDMSVNIIYTPLKDEPVEPKPVEEKGTLVTKYVDEDGNDIAESNKEELTVGQEFKAVAKDIEGYTLDGESEILGEMVKDGKTVIFEYSKDKEEPVKPVEPTENLKEIDKALKTNINEINKSRGIILGAISMILTTCLGAFATTFKKDKKEVKKDK